MASAKRVKFVPCSNFPTVVLKNELEKNSPPERRLRVGRGIFFFRLPKTCSELPATKILKSLGAKFARASKIASIGRPLRKVSSSSSLTRSRSLTDSFESHRAEDVEECIEFFNMRRSNSVSVIR